MSNRLGGKQGTAYLGTNANQPPNWSFNERPPTMYDTQNVSLGDLWFDNSAMGINKIWILVSLQGDTESKGSIAQWVQFNGGNLNLQFQTQTGISLPFGDTIKIYGGNDNINTDSLTPNQVTINLNPDLVIDTLTVTSLDPNASVITNGSSMLATATGGFGTVLTANGSGTPPSFSELTSTDNSITIVYDGSDIDFTITSGGGGTVTGLRADDTNIASPSGGIINVYGDSNITTNAAIANTVQVTLNNDVTISGTYTTTAGDVIVDNGVIAAGNTVNGVSSSQLIFQKSRSGGVITSGDDIGRISFEGHDGTSFVETSRIEVDSEGTIGTDQIASRMIFSTRETADSSVQPKLTIAANGDITFNEYSTGVLRSNSSGDISSVSGGVGQILRSNSTNVPTWATVASGSGISISNVDNTITISSSAAAATYPTDSGTATPSAGALTIHGTHGINTSGSGSTVTVAINNAITLGDLIPLAANAGALTAATGDIIISAGDLRLPITNSAANQGIIKFNGTNWIHVYPGANNFYGGNAGNFTMDNVLAVANVGVGNTTLVGLTTGRDNTTIGGDSQHSCTSGSQNTSLGTGTLYNNSTGSFNIAVGFEALDDITSGNDNCCIGTAAGQGYITGSESYNLIFGGVSGVSGENNVMRLGGGTGTGRGNVLKTFIGGVRGVTTTNNNAISVLVDSSGQFGTISSSIKSKENVKEMNDISSALIDLKPVIFNYINDINKLLHTGLIAEEVEKVMPSLVAYDENKEPMSVKYHELPVLILNELQKLIKRVEIIEKSLS